MTGTTDRSTTIMVLNPNSTAAMTAAALAAARAVAPPGTRVVAGDDHRGPASVESHTEEVAGAASVLAQVVDAESDPVTAPDAYVVACFGDTGVAAAREAARGPVVGMSESALMAAALLAHRFTVVTTPRRTLAQADRVVAALGLAHRCSVHAVDVPVADLVTSLAPGLAPGLVMNEVTNEVTNGATNEASSEDEQLLRLLTQAARAAMDAEGAEALVLGCAGLSGLVTPLQRALGIPVIDGVAVATAMAGALVACGLRTSRVGAFAGPVQRPSAGQA